MGLFSSSVANFLPNKPLTFRSPEGETKTFPQLVTDAAREFAEGYSFWINPFLWSGHTQTAYAALNSFKNADQIHYKREIITVNDVRYTVDGEQLAYDEWEGKSTFAVDYVKNDPDPDHLQYKPDNQTDDLPPRTEFLKPGAQVFADDRPLLVVLHGLSGGSFESYVRALLNEVTQGEGNFDALVINSRGCAHHTITSPQLFCGLWTNDLRYFINEHVKQRWPKKKIFLAGFSLGGAIVANYIGQEKDLVYRQIKGAFVLGAPWDFVDSSHVLRESLLGDRVYSTTMCKNLLKLMDKHFDGQMKSQKLVEKYRSNPDDFTLSRLSDFDDNFTSKLFGFNNASEYYHHASPAQRLFKFRVPTVILNSLDDPVCGYRSLPTTEVKINPYTMLVTTSTGGHLGWFDLKFERWYAKPIAKVMSALSKDWEHEVNEMDLPLDVEKSFKHDRLYVGKN